MVKVDPISAKAQAAPASMTGFASARGALETEQGAWDWVWDLRAVNNRGLDLRLRLPEWIEGLETAVRSALQAKVARGSVTLSLRLNRRGQPSGLKLDPALLAQAVRALAEVEAAAEAAGVTLQHSTAAEILTLRGLFEGSADDTDPAPLLAALTAELPGLIADFDAMRRAEGAALAAILTAQLDQIEALSAEARRLAEARRGAMAETLQQNLAKVMGAVEADPARVAQELALLAVKADVSEELDRLAAHIAAARKLLREAGPIGRKFDFLTQEFNREANTLCSKAGAAELTRCGLDLKVVIDQMREQVQNLE